MFKNFLHHKNHVDIFWTWFEKNSSSYTDFEVDQENLFDILNQKLNKIDENLTFEFSPKFDDGDRELIISADGIQSSFPSVLKLVKSAPQIPNWRIVAFRQPHLEYTRINYKNLELSFSDVFFRYSIEGAKVGIELNIRNFKDDNDYITASYLVLDNVLGEYDTETYLSWIERKLLDENQIDTLYPIEELPNIVNEIKISEQKNGL